MLALFFCSVSCFKFLNHDMDTNKHEFHPSLVSIGGSFARGSKIVAFVGVVQ
jgi:hypothetical protein